MHYVTTAINQFLELFKNIKRIFCGKIQILRIKLSSFANFEDYHIITNKYILHLLEFDWYMDCFQHGNQIGKGNEQIHITKEFKFTLATMKDGMSSTIFAINGMYMVITYFVGLNMLIQHFLHYAKSCSLSPSLNL